MICKSNCFFLTFSCEFQIDYMSMEIYIPQSLKARVLLKYLLRGTDL